MVASTISKRYRKGRNRYQVSCGGGVDGASRCNRIEFVSTLPAILMYVSTPHERDSTARISFIPDDVGGKNTDREGSLTMKSWNTKTQQVSTRYCTVSVVRDSLSILYAACYCHYSPYLLFTSSTITSTASTTGCLTMAWALKQSRNQKVYSSIPSTLYPPASYTNF